MATQSKICGTAIEDTSVGTISISNVGYLTTDDTNYATIAEITTDNATVYSHRIVTYNYGFEIPVGSTINHVHYYATGNCNYYTPDGGETEYMSTPYGYRWRDADGNLQGYSGGQMSWGAAFAEHEFYITGTPSLANINNANYGVAFQMLTSTYRNSGQWWIDFVRIEVDYTPPSGPVNLKTANGLVKASVKVVNGLAIASIKGIDGLT